MNRIDPEKMREAVAGLPPLTTELLNELLAFQERHGLSSAELADHVRPLINLFQEVTRATKGSRFDAGPDS